MIEINALISAGESGTVVEFDEHVGLGKVANESGASYVFHCTQISGGSRTIEVGTAVTFDVVQRHKHTEEAYSVTPVTPT